MYNDYIKFNELYHGVFNSRLHPRDKYGRFTASDIGNIENKAYDKVNDDYKKEKNRRIKSLEATGQDTDLGKKYKMTEEEYLNRVEREKTKLMDELAAIQETENIKKTKDVTGASSNLVNQVASMIPSGGGKYVHGNYEKLSDEEMRKVINRLNLERQYAQAIGDEKYIPTGKEKVREFLQTAGSALAIASSALGIYYLIKKPTNEQNEGKKK